MATGGYVSFYGANDFAVESAAPAGLDPRRVSARRGDAADQERGENQAGHWGLLAGRSSVRLGA